MKRILVVLIVIIFILAIVFFVAVALHKSMQKNVNVSNENSTERVEETPEPIEAMPIRTIEPTVVEGDFQPTSSPSSSSDEFTLEDLPSIISGSAYNYSEIIRKVMGNPQRNLSVYTEGGEYLEDASVYKYNDQYFVISKDRKGFIAEYNKTLQRYEAKELLDNVDVYNAQTYFEAGFSLIHTNNTIEIWQLGEKKDFAKTEWAKYLKRTDVDHFGYCLSNPKQPYYFHVDDGKIFFFRFYADADEARLDNLYEIKAEYYVNYKDRLFYKEGPCVYMFNGFEVKRVVDNVESMSYDKDTLEPIISLQNGETIYGNELL